MKMPVILLIGRSKSGKDTFIKYARKEYSKIRRIAFADELKKMAAINLGLTLEELERDKEKYREFIIFGGMLARSLNPDVWVDMAISKNYYTENDEVIIFSDCRFPNELRVVKNHYKDRPVYIIEIDVQEKELLKRGYNRKIWDSPSETAFQNADLWKEGAIHIYNNGTEKEFEVTVRSLIAEIFNGLQEKVN
jgi:predicted kinase